jgi:ribosomal protein L14
VRRGDIRHAVVVRARKEIQRPDGSLVKFDDNACVLINKAGDPIGTRMNGSFVYNFFNIVFYFGSKTPRISLTQGLGIVGAELRGKQWSKILSLAPMHL